MKLPKHLKKELEEELALIASYRAAGIISDRVAQTWRRSTISKLIKLPDIQSGIPRHKSKVVGLRQLSILWLLKTELPPRVARLIYRVYWTGGRVVGHELVREAQAVKKLYPDLAQQLLRNGTLDY